MNKVTIGDVAVLRPKLKLGIDSSENDPVSFIPMAGIGENGKVVRIKERKLGDCKKGFSYFSKGDVLLAKITPCMENGKAAYIEDIPNEHGFGSTEFHVLRPSENVDGKYLFYAIWNTRFRAVAKNNMTGSAGQKRLSASYIQDHEIPLPPLPEQKRIVAILDKADAIRRKRQETLTLTENLIQATFLDMFGDPVTNPKGWEVRKLKESAFVQGGFAFKSKDYCEQGVRLVKISNVHSGKLKWDEIDCVPDSFLETYSDFALKPDDLVIALTRPIIKSLNSVKIATVGPMDPPSLLNQRVARFVILPNSPVDKSYLLAFCGTQFFKKTVKKFCSESLQPNMSTKQLEEMRIATPPLDRQRRFAKIVSLMEKQRVRIRKYLEESDNLFNSLQQRAFSGELSNN